MVCESFPPLYREDARVLILGTMPSVVSLRETQYYAHPRNAFWPIQEILWDTSTKDYTTRTQMLLEHGVALWDVAGQCRREGSLDAPMRAIVPNDIGELVQRLPRLRYIFCNGKTALTLYRRFFPSLPVPYAGLPSTSPAYTLPFAKKLEAWRVVAEEARK